MKKPRSNIANAFGASLSFGFQKEARDYSLSKADKLIEKYAGIDIYDPTEENIEQFIRRFVLNELASTSENIPVTIALNVLEMSSANTNHVSEAQGVVTLRFLNKDLEIPFMISDGELNPFDVIQMDGQRVPYSRENLTKIIHGMKHQHEKAKQSDSPYTGVEDATNPSTAQSFLGNVLQIRDTVSSGKMSDGNNYVFASEIIDNWLEKVSTLPELTEEHFGELENLFMNKAADELAEALEKIAEAAPEGDGESMHLFDKVKALDFVDARGIEHGTTVMFPERVGNDVTVTYALVLSDSVELPGHTANTKILLTQDARVKILDGKDRVMVLKTQEDVPFKLPLTEMKTLEEKDVFTAIKGDEMLPLLRLNTNYTRYYQSLREGKETDCPENRKDHPDHSVYNVDYVKTPVDLTNHSYTRKDNTLRLCALSDAYFDTMPYNKFTQAKADELGVDVMELKKYLRPNEVISGEKKSYPHDEQQNDAGTVVVVDPEVKVVRIKGELTTFLRDVKDLDKLASDVYDDVFEKTASAEKNKVKVICRNNQDEIFDITIKYVDNSYHIPSQKIREIGNVNWQNSMNTLKVIGFTATEATEILKKAKREPKAVYALPENHNAKAVSEGQVRSMAVTKAKNTLKNALKPQDIAKVVAGATTTHLLADALINSEGPITDAVSNLMSFASDAATLSAEFEKIAQDKHSAHALEMAKVLSTAAYFHEKLAAHIGGKPYPRIFEMAEDIMKDACILEKKAYDLMQLKTAQYVARDEIVNTNYIQAAVRALDNFYSVAHAVAGIREG